MNTFTDYKVSSEELLQGFERGGGGECSVPVEKHLESSSSTESGSLFMVCGSRESLNN